MTRDGLRLPPPTNTNSPLRQAELRLGNSHEPLICWRGRRLHNAAFHPRPPAPSLRPVTLCGHETCCRRAPALRETTRSRLCRLPCASPSGYLLQNHCAGQRRSGVKDVGRVSSAPSMPLGAFPYCSLMVVIPNLTPRKTPIILRRRCKKWTVRAL